MSQGKGRQYLLIVANAHIEGAAGSVIPPQQKFQSLQDALKEKQKVLNHPWVVMRRINAGMQRWERIVMLSQPLCCSQLPPRIFPLLGKELQRF